MKGVFRELLGWAVEHTGIWGTRFIALVITALILCLVWVTKDLPRDYLREFATPPEGRTRLGIGLSAIAVCGGAYALILWLIAAAWEVFPDMLGL